MKQIQLQSSSTEDNSVIIQLNFVQCCFNSVMNGASL